MVFNLWQVGFAKKSTGFNVEQGANKFETDNSCENYVYTYKNADNTLFLAESTVSFPFALNFNQNGVEPKITYIKFENNQCGNLPQCPTRTTTAASTTTTPEVVPELTGDSCGDYVKVLYSTKGFDSGVLRFKAPTTTRTWEFEVRRNFIHFIH